MELRNPTQERNFLSSKSQPCGVLLLGITLNKDVIAQWKLSCAHVRRLGTSQVQYIPRNMHTVFALLCFVVVIH